MPIYKLEPVDAQRGSERWEATSLFEVCWIDAPSEDVARVTIIADATDDDGVGVAFDHLLNFAINRSQGAGQQRHAGGR